VLLPVAVMEAEAVTELDGLCRYEEYHGVRGDSATGQATQRQLPPASPARGREPDDG
jgi:hypothetical protein